MLHVLFAISALYLAQIQSIDAADCAASQRNDLGAFVRTLAPEYVGINVDGSRDTYAALAAASKKHEPATQRVVACSTTVSRTEASGARYYVYGLYAQEIVDAKHRRFSTSEHFRDTWERRGGRWLQTQSVAYDLTIRLGQKTVRHLVLPAADRP